MHHDGLRGNGIGRDRSVVHLLVVSQCHEMPGGDAFGQCEMQAHLSCLIAGQCGHPEGGLVEIVTDGGDGLVGRESGGFLYSLC